MSPDGSIRRAPWKRFHADRRQRSLRHQFTSSARRRPESAGAGSRDIELGLEPGEAVGLIGANGSGKSTLLKIMAGVMYPYAGRLDVNGRVGALLEVRAGLHAELTGRENVYLYGGLLGLARSDVAARFDEILEFSALEDAIDRQVKFYSSGMQMRLGFSVAAFLEPDILLVDEALAVGDAFFQQRCLDRMRDLLQMGTTLVLVSTTSPRRVGVRAGVWLRDGVIEYDGDTRTTLGNYRTWFDDAYHDWIDEVGAEESVYHVGAISVLDAGARSRWRRPRLPTGAHGRPHPRQPRGHRGAVVHRGHRGHGVAGLRLVAWSGSRRAPPPSPASCPTCRWPPAATTSGSSSTGPARRPAPVVAARGRSR
jgi:ABC-type polysaccharide/polyol phosphate transport system ATPase subunit